MRELKFRAWDSADKMMYHNIQDGIKFDDGSCYSFDKFLRNSVGDPDMEDYHRWSIMQYTGLMDKNGKEIYEGDIIQSKSEMVRLVTNEPTGRIAIKNYTVRWEHEIARWGRFKDGKFELLSGLKKEYLDQWYTVIGNIYENPELIGE